MTKHQDKTTRQEAAMVEHKQAYPTPPYRDTFLKTAFHQMIVHLQRVFHLCFLQMP